MKELYTRRLRVAALCMLAAVGLFTARPAWAQVLYGSVVGTVVDAQHSAIPLATVRLVSTGTSQSREATTDESGTFSFPSLPGGSYDITVTKAGFQTYTARGLSVAPDATVRVDAVLPVGTIEQKIEVSAAAAVLQTDSAEVRSEIGSRSLDAVPVPLGRNYQNLLVTVPGLTPPANQHSVAANPSRGLTFSVNGASRNANNIKIDGALANNVWLPHVAAYVPALDAIETVSAVTASADAQQGLVGGGGGERADQERHQRSARLGLRIPRRQCAQGQAFLPAGGTGQAEIHQQPVWRHRRRPHHPQQALFLRKL